jgi:hypothetical protein
MSMDSPKLMSSTRFNDIRLQPGSTNISVQSGLVIQNVRADSVSLTQAPDTPQPHHSR